MKPPFYVLLLSVLLIACPSTFSNAESVAEKPVAATVYIDLSDTSIEQPGGIQLHNDLSGLVIKQLEELGFEVVAYQGVRPAAAKYSLRYNAQWRRHGTRVFIGRFDAFLFDDRREIGRVLYRAPRSGPPENGAAADIANPISAVVTDLMRNVRAARTLFVARHEGPELQPPHPSQLLPPFNLYEANKLKQVLSAVKYPIASKDLLGRLGGEERLYYLTSATLQTDDRTYGVVDYALSDIKHRLGYFFLEFVLDAPPRNDGSDQVRAAFLMFNAHGLRFAQAAAQPVFGKAQAMDPIRRRAAAPPDKRKSDGN